MSNYPLAQFASWLEEAKNTPSITEPTAMALATSTKDGQPSVRIVLLKEYDESGFVFYTNLESRKSSELIHNPKASLCFYWMALERQIRIEGNIERVSDAQSDAYFATRPRDSQIGAWASRQSKPLLNRDEFLQAIAEKKAEFEGKEIPRPPFWGGWKLVPEKIEFWKQVEFRLHEREIFTHKESIKSNDWEKSFIYP